MTSNNSVVSFRQPDAVDDLLTAVLRSGARRLLAQAIEAEAEAFLALMSNERLADGRKRVVRHGHGPERLVQTGIGPGAFGCAKRRGRGAAGQAARPCGWRSRRRAHPLHLGHPAALGQADAEPGCLVAGSLPARRVDVWRTPRFDGRLPGGARGLLGREAPNLSPSAAARLRDAWQAGYARWQGRDLGVSRSESAWVGSAACLRLGGRHPPAGTHGAASRMPDDKGVAGTCWC